MAVPVEKEKIKHIKRLSSPFLTEYRFSLLEKHFERLEDKLDRLSDKVDFQDQRSFR